MFLNFIQFGSSGDFAYILQVCGFDFFFQGLIFISIKGYQ